jgi:two-component system, LytTR family, response regulator LytT
LEHIKILIVEDEVLIAEDLKDILKTFGLKKIEMVHDKTSALENLRLNKPDIAILDIRMEKELDGLEIGEFIQNNYKLPFIFITAHSDIEMIKKIIKTKPVGYITKPFKKSDLFANINLAIEQLTTNNKLFIKDGYSTHVININEIVYIESEGNYINIFTSSKKYLSRQNMESILLDIDSNDFLKIHRSYVVNLNKVKKYSSKEVIINEITLPISKTFYDVFIEIMKNKE